MATRIFRIVLIDGSMGDVIMSSRIECKKSNISSGLQCRTVHTPICSRVTCLQTGITSGGTITGCDISRRRGSWAGSVVVLDNNSVLS
jgi:hypothetical protein